MSNFWGSLQYDISEPARRSYLEYDPQATYRIGDVRQLKSESILSDLDGRTLHGIIGGPPCQGFSLAGKRLTEAEINELVLAYARVVQQMEPYFLVMENVPQLLYHPLFKPLLEIRWSPLTQLVKSKPKGVEGAR